MKKGDYEKLCELEQYIYDHLQAAFLANDYSLELENKGFGTDDYVNAKVTICGLGLRCALNKKGYVCWFCGDPIESLIKQVPHLERKIVAQAKRTIKKDAIAYCQERIKHYQDKLDELKK